MTANRGGAERGVPRPGASESERAGIVSRPAPAAISPDLERALADFEQACWWRGRLSAANTRVISPRTVDHFNARYANARARLIELFAERVPLEAVEPADVRPWWQEG